MSSRQQGFIGRLEDKLGLPKLSDMKGTLNEVNTLVQSIDQKRLTAIKQVLEIMLKLQKEGGPEGLRMFIQVVTVISQLPEARVDKISKVTADVRETVGTVHKILQMLPADMLKGADVMAMVKDAMKEGK